MAILDPLIGNVAFDMLFAVFVIISTWVIVAILTAVVAENMLRSSRSCEEEEEAENNQARARRSVVRLRNLFTEIDTDRLHPAHGLFLERPDRCAQRESFCERSAALAPPANRPSVLTERATRSTMLSQRTSCARTCSGRAATL